MNFRAVQSRPARTISVGSLLLATCVCILLLALARLPEPRFQALVRRDKPAHVDILLAQQDTPAAASSPPDLTSAAARALPGSDPAAPAQLPLSVVVLSHNDARFNRTCLHLRSIGFKTIKRKVPMSRTDARVVARGGDAPARAGTISNMLSFAEAWEEFAREPGDKHEWRVFVEDDVWIARGVDRSGERVLDAVRFGSELARSDGFMRLGSCAPFYRGGEAVTHDNVRFARAAGRCAHAYALARWRAETFWADMESKKIPPPPDAYQAGPWEIFMDVRFFGYELAKPAWVVGAHLYGCPVSGHDGILCQDRDSLPSEIDRLEQGWASPRSGN